MDNEQAELKLFLAEILSTPEEAIASQAVKNIIKIAEAVDFVN